VSIASNMETTSSISGRLSGLASQHRFITFARELGQHLGISGLRFWDFNMKNSTLLHKILSKKTRYTKGEMIGVQVDDLPDEPQLKSLLRS
jgi:hypothetical protein